MALNPGSKTTPVRTVFNCSQVFRGYSLNSSLALGPENGLNSLHAILLRFREDEVAAQGDITKQYYMLRIEPDDAAVVLEVCMRGKDQNILHDKNGNGFKAKFKLCRNSNERNK